MRAAASNVTPDRSRVRATSDVRVERHIRRVCAQSNRLRLGAKPRDAIDAFARPANRARHLAQRRPRIVLRRGVLEPTAFAANDSNPNVTGVSNRANEDDRCRKKSAHHRL
jgi:hypothetical protein